MTALTDNINEVIRLTTDEKAVARIGQSPKPYYSWRKRVEKYII